MPSEHARPLDPRPICMGASNRVKHAHGPQKTAIGYNFRSVNLINSSMDRTIHHGPRQGDRRSAVRAWTKHRVGQDRSHSGLMDPLYGFVVAGLGLLMGRV